MRNTITAAKVPPYFLGFREVMAGTSLGASTLRRMIRAGQFPAPVAIGPRRMAWVRAEIETWCEQRVAAARQA